MGWDSGFINSYNRVFTIMEKFLEWFKKVRWGKQIVDQTLHLFVPILITFLVYNWPWFAVVPACFIMYEREYYQKAAPVLSFLENLTHIKWLAIDLIFLHISFVICVGYIFYKEFL